MTSLERTMLDLAEVERPHRLEKALEESVRLNKLDGKKLEELINATVEGYEVDAYWPSHDVIVEIDSYEFHGSKPAFKRDRTRDIALDLAGYRVIRFTDEQVLHEAEYVAAVLARYLRG